MLLQEAFNLVEPEVIILYYFWIVDILCLGLASAIRLNFSFADHWLLLVNFGLLKLSVFLQQRIEAQKPHLQTRLDHNELVLLACSLLQLFSWKLHSRIEERLVSISLDLHYGVRYLVSCEKVLEIRFFQA